MPAVRRATARSRPAATKAFYEANRALVDAFLDRHDRDAGRRLEIDAAACGVRVSASDTTSRIGEIKAPTLVMVGDDETHGDTEDTHFAFAHVLAQKIPNAKLVDLPRRRALTEIRSTRRKRRIETIREFLAATTAQCCAEASREGRTTTRNPAKSGTFRLRDRFASRGAHDEQEAYVPPSLPSSAARRERNDGCEERSSPSQRGRPLRRTVLITQAVERTCDHRPSAGCEASRRRTSTESGASVVVRLRDASRPASLEDDKGLRCHGFERGDANATTDARRRAARPERGRAASARF